MNRISLRTIILVLLLLVSNAGRGEEFRFRKYQVNNGLSENAVYCMLQDCSGFIWLGTKDGLNRFDGIGCRTFRTRPDDPSSLGNNLVRSLVQLDSMHLGVGTDRGLYVMDLATESFSRFDARTPEGDMVGGWVNSVAGDSRGRMWIATPEGIYMWAGDRLQRFTAEAGQIPSNTAWKVFISRDGTLWGGTREGLVYFDEERGGFVACSRAGVAVGDDEILAIHEDSGGTLWLGTWSGGLLRYDRRAESWRSFLNSGSEHYITHIRAVFSHSDHELLLGSDDGLYLFDTATGQCERKDSPGDDYGLSDQSVYCIMRDREEGLWVGTFYGGANYMLPRNNAMELYPAGSPHFSGKVVRQFCPDAKGNLWIATEDGGLSYFDTAARRFDPAVKVPGLSYHNVRALLLDGDRLFIGTFSRGLDVYDLSTRTIRHYMHDEEDPASLGDNCVFSLYRSRDGRIWVGTPAGLGLYDPHGGGSFEQVTPTRGMFVYDIYEDTSGTLWLAAHSSGIVAYDPDAGTCRNYRHDPADPASPGHYKVTGIYCDSRHRLWFSTDGGGISRYNRATDDFTTWSERDGLPNNMVYGLLDDSHGNLWISSNSGITRFDPETGHMKHYTQADGLQSNEFNYKACYKAPDGKMYFGGINGFNAFYPDQLLTNTLPPPVKITSLRLLNSDGTLPALPADGIVKLPHDKASFTVSYAGLSYRAPSKNLFACRLEGLDEEFSLMGDRREVTYVNLPPGRYTFRVKASNNDGVWNESGDSLRIVIRPPFYGTTVARIVYIMLAICILWIAIRLYMRRSRRIHERRMSEFVAEQERRNLTSKIDFFTQITHEIRTPLSLIKAPLEAVMATGEGSEQTKANLRLVERNVMRLYDLVIQLLDFRRLETANYDLRLETADVNEVISSLVEQFRPSLTGRDITLEYICPEGLDTRVVSDREALTKIATNLMSNAVKFTHNRVTVSLAESHGGLALGIADNGEGISDDDKQKIFEPFYQIRSDNVRGTGIGLSLVRHLVDKLGYTLAVEDNASGGAVFTLVIPHSATQSCEPAPEIATPEMPREEGRTSVLFVDDNEDLRRFMEQSLADTYSVVTAPDGERALELLAATWFDVVVADVMMPVMDGITLVERIRSDSALCHIPVVLLSARTTVENKVEGLSTGADAYLEKPFSLPLLKAQVESLLANRARLYESFRTAPLTSQQEFVTQERDREFLDRVDREVEEHLADSSFDMEQLAAAVCMSHSNLQRKIKGICGMTPNSYMRTYRLKRAAELLLDGRYRINEVCFLVGFNNASYFSRCFREQFGVLPKEYGRSR